ncbi:Uncharacterised protein [Klebsiella pneumoniae]|nr:Uncharacterised protein [Klebsiella pneumoniae]
MSRPSLSANFSDSGFRTNKGPVEERAFTLMVSNDGERPFPLSGPLLRNVHIDAS